MTKEQYFQMKDELKALAKQISSDRNEFKNRQRNFSTGEKEYGTLDDAYSGNNDAKQKGISEVYRPMYKMQSDLLDMKHEYRAKHIAYSMARGRTIDQIEPTTSNEGGKDYWRYEAYRKAKKLCEELDIKPLFDRKEKAA
jgi:hypothetical protein